MKLKRQLLSVLATGVLILNSAAPVAAGMTLEISGNGSDSDNDVKVELQQQTTVVQSNEAKVENKIDASASTGGNEAEDNTGGNVSIQTGNATTDVKVENTLNSNTATVDCCNAGNVDVLISGNGSDSENEVELEMEKSGIEVFQYNKADVDNEVDANAKTGNNEAEGNTGGDVSIDTGHATTSVSISTTANANWAKVGGGNGSSPTLSLRILGNGSNSENEIDLDLEGGVLIRQDNEADVDNDVDAKAKTGGNEAEDNTGGSVSIETGNADVTVDVDNLVNFNWADLDCGCLFDLLAKISGNGADSENEIEAELGGAQEVFQGNCAEQPTEGVSQNGRREDCELENEVDATAKSGNNEAEGNTGDPHGDPSIETGNAESTVEVTNTGNSNVFGSDVPSDWPNFEFNFNLSLSWEQLLALLGLSG